MMGTMGRPARSAWAVSPADVAMFGFLSVAAVLSLVVPEGQWRGLCDLLVRARMRFAPAGPRVKMRQVPSFMSTVLGCTPEAVFRASHASYYEQSFQILRASIRRDWRPRARLSGEEHVREGLARGKGVILWVTPTVCSDFMTKVAFHKAGLRVSQLSRLGHGFSRTRLGIRFLNPVWTRVEDRYLMERVQIRGSNLLAATKTLRDRLAANGVVSITVGATGAQTIDAPLFDGALRMATGAAHLAFATGAALLPVFCVRDGTAFRVCVCERLEVPLSGGRADALRTVGEQYGAVMERFLREHPLMWTGWGSSDFRTADVVVKSAG